ncbi:hypothetical protein K502DRAFT_328700 [Neoconidiobolus thromboides FSU 785]|nr:hypothetical protein K502DRAFT_328700 [Neoconidiobolus thromboides FSU 785]
MPTTEKTNVTNETSPQALKAGHAPAVKVGGMRVPQANPHVSVKVLIDFQLTSDPLPGNLSRAEKQALTNNEDFSHDQEEQIENAKEEKLKEEKLKRAEQGQKQKDLERNTLPKNQDMNMRNNNTRVFQPNKHVGN